MDQLVEHGVLERRGYSEHPPRHDYLPTRMGADLFPVIVAIMAWGDRWTAGPAGPPAVIHHSCGAHSSVQVVCDGCGEPLKLSDSTPEAGPGGRTGIRTRVLGPILASRRHPG